MSDSGFSPPPLRTFMYVSCTLHEIEPSDPKNGRNDPISSSMIVSGCLKPFLAILDFFDSYRTLATLCKLEETRNFDVF